jgi:ferredoxin-NADP reductase
MGSMAEMPPPSVFQTAFDSQTEGTINLERPLYTARLERRLCLSESAQCFHLEFKVEGLPSFDFAAGQFVSIVAPEPLGRPQSRAYSIASAPRRNEFDLCVNRVEGGFFSNLLCDLNEGESVKCHGPHGYFLLRQPLTDSILIATGTGIAPMVGFAQALFPQHGLHAGEDLSGGREIWMIYGTRYVTDIYYQGYFERLAGQYENFHYIATLSHPDDAWRGSRGYVQEYVQKIAAEQAAKNESATVAEGCGLNIHAYICGLNEMVSANRETLNKLGWQRKQIIFERYD